MNFRGLEGSAVRPGMRVQEVQGSSHLNEVIWYHWVIENCGTSRPVEVHVLDFKTSLFPLVLVLQRAEEALAAAKCSVCSHHVSPSQAARIPHLTDREGQEQDLPGDLSSMANPVADEHSASCRLRPSNVRAEQSFTYSLL